MLSINHLNKSFGNLHVLKDLSFQVKKGEIVSIIGPSGSGKSTFLRTINLLEEPQTGHMKLSNAEYNMAGISEEDKLKIRRQVAMVFQNYNLFANKTGLGNITEGLIHSKGLSREKANELGQYYLEQVGLADKRHAYPHELSGGQQQRIGIARALALEPEIILFDEPTSALDPELVWEVLEVIRKVANHLRTLLIVTHEMQFAKEISDRIVFMDQGKIMADGRPEEIFGSHSDQRLRRFLDRV